MRHPTGTPALPSRFASLANFSCPGSLVAGRGAGREMAICQAVVELLNENSYESVSMDAVAARAKASKATIYRRWTNKDALVIDALQRFFAVGGAASPDTGNMRDDLIEYFLAQLRDPRIFAASTAAAKALVYAAPGDPAFAQVVRSVMHSAQLTGVGTILARARARSEVSRPVDAHLVLEVIHAQFCTRSGLAAGEVDTNYVTHVVDDVLVPVIRHAGASVDAVSP